MNVSGTLKSWLILSTAASYVSVHILTSVRCIQIESVLQVIIFQYIPILTARMSTRPNRTAAAAATARMDGWINTNKKVSNTGDDPVTTTTESAQVISTSKPVTSKKIVKTKTIEELALVPEPMPISTKKRGAKKTNEIKLDKSAPKEQVDETPVTPVKVKTPKRNKTEEDVPSSSASKKTASTRTNKKVKFSEKVVVMEFWVPKKQRVEKVSNTGDASTKTTKNKNKKAIAVSDTSEVPESTTSKSAQVASTSKPVTSKKIVKTKTIEELALVPEPMPNSTKKRGAKKTNEIKLDKSAPKEQVDETPVTPVKVKTPKRNKTEEDVPSSSASKKTESTRTNKKVKFSEKVVVMEFWVPKKQRVEKVSNTGDASTKTTKNKNKKAIAVSDTSEVPESTTSKSAQVASTSKPVTSKKIVKTKTIEELALVPEPMPISTKKRGAKKTNEIKLDKSAPKEQVDETPVTPVKVKTPKRNKTEEDVPSSSASKKTESTRTNKKVKFSEKVVVMEFWVPKKQRVEKVSNTGDASTKTTKNKNKKAIAVSDTSEVPESTTSKSAQVASTSKPKITRKKIVKTIDVPETMPISTKKRGAKKTNGIKLDESAPKEQVDETPVTPKKRGVQTKAYSKPKSNSRASKPLVSTNVEPSEDHDVKEMECNFLLFLFLSHLKTGSTSSPLMFKFHFSKSMLKITVECGDLSLLISFIMLLIRFSSLGWPRLLLWLSCRFLYKNLENLEICIEIVS
ncbi:hypothetical protein BLOT_009354 [Blomia tropicalis]|nr:hypothetical protein BLOT_009354 [Blomia tropicalis]